MNPAERALHPTRAQVDYLIGKNPILEKNPSLAKGFSKVPSARDTCRKTWEELTGKLNSLGGCVKSWKQWTKYWADKKSAVKKKAVARYRARNKTGGGLESVVDHSEVEEKILALMGGESFCTGDRHLQINPLNDHLQLSQESPSLLANSSIILPAPLLDHHDASTGSLFFDVVEADVPVTVVETQRGAQIECVPGTSYPSERPSVVRMVSPSPRDITVPSPTHTPPGTVVSSPTHPATPSGSGNHPARRRLNVSRLGTHNATSSARPRPRLRRSPPSQRRSQFVSVTEKFIALEEQRIELNRQNSQMMEVFLTRQIETDQSRNEALQAVAEGLKMLAEALKNK